MGSDGAVGAETAAANPEVRGSPPREHEEEEEEEQVTPVVEKKKGRKREPAADEEEAEEGSTRKRPSRERKTVERYSAMSPKRASASKALSIVQGSGTKLRDIPNVVFKLSKRKADENLQALHTLLFGRKSNVHMLKRNILQFSGFVWTENKDKNKSRVKEKLDKFTKDKLIDLCEVLDIHFPRTSTKKEDISAMLLEFLESPHVTRDVLLAEKDQKGKKRRNRTKVSLEEAEDVSSGKETKKNRKSAATEVKKRQKHASEVVAEDEPEDSAGSDVAKSASSGEEDNNGLEESDHDKLDDEVEENDSERSHESEKESEEGQPEDAVDSEDRERTLPIKKTSSVKSGKSPSKRASKNSAQAVEGESNVAVHKKNSSNKEHTRKSSKGIKKEKADAVNKEDTPSKSSKSKKEVKNKAHNKDMAVVKEKKTKKKETKQVAAKASVKEQGKGNKRAGPSTEELHAVVSDILKEVDFNVATLADILRKLGAHFNMDLMDRKTEVKSIIEEVINNMTDDDDEGEEDEDNSAGNDKEANTNEAGSDGDGKE